MSLAPGTRVGVYEVVGLIGVGGMGEVHRARDTRLGRDAALKTLPDEFARDPERLARFEREARTLAQLNHPHIASIYGLEVDASAPALAMEMVEGETLAARIAVGPIPIDEALAIARQIADALEHAHEKGIVHRDLKPANVKLAPTAGAPNVKVLDFGLARAMMPDAVSGSAASAVSSPTITTPAHMTHLRQGYGGQATQAGMILGTASYMAPEQARGKVVDQRADIWAFGCVLFEMITARRAFPGDEIADVLAKVIQSEPDWQALPVSTSRALRTLLERCLRKDPARRIHSIADVRLDLEEVVTGSDHDAVGAQGPAPRSRWPTMLAGAAIGAAIVAGITLAVLSIRGSAPSAAPVLRYSIAMPEGAVMTRLNSGRMNFAVSPDGEKLVVGLLINGKRRLFVRRLDETEFRELSSTDDATTVFWAPDSRRLAFVTTGGVRRVDLSGVGSQHMITLPAYGPGVWGPDDTIMMSPPSRPPYRWPAQGGAAEPMGVLPPTTGRLVTSWLPERQGFLYLDLDSNRVSLMRAQEGQDPQPITQFESLGGGSASALYRSGKLLIASTEASGRTTLTAQPFDAEAGHLTGAPVVLVTDLNPAFSASENGVLVYGEGGLVGERFAWLDARGALVSYASGTLRVGNFDLSADERTLAVQPPGGGLSLHDLTRNVTSPLIPRGVDPIWSADGRQIAFAVPRAQDQGIHVMPAFGGASRVLYAAKDQTLLDDWSRDGRWMAGHLGSGPGILIPLAVGASPIVFEDKTANAAVDEVRFSPDGRWVAYGLNTGSSGDVFLTAVPPTGERWQVSVAGGAQPRWRADGKALYYLSPTGSMMMVDVSARPGALRRSALHARCSSLGCRSRSDRTSLL